MWQWFVDFFISALAAMLGVLLYFTLVPTTAA